jgi:HK97 gp10 family phage protein
MFEFRVEGDDIYEKIFHFENLPNKIFFKIYDTLVDSVNDIRTDIMESMQNTQTDPARAYKRGNKIHYASKPGNPPAIDSGNLIGKILLDVSKDQVAVGTNVEYGKYLESGTYRMEPRPWLEPAIERNENKIMNNISKAIKEAFR